MEELLPEVLVPEIVVGIELDECERPVHGGERAQLGEEDRVVSAETERRHARARDLLDCGPRTLERIGGRAGYGRDVAVIDERELLDDVDPQKRVVVPEHDRGASDRLGAEARARAEHDRAVGRDADDGNVDPVEVAHVR
jgi:hypothetical protein